MHQIANLVLLSLAAACAPAWAINKCTGSDGRVSYQAEPCAAGAAGSARVDTSGAGQPDPEGAIRARQDVLRARTLDAINAGKVGVGMSAADVRRAWGAPDKINRTLSASGAEEQWIYRSGRIGYDQYVYLSNGVVTTVQSPR